MEKSMHAVRCVGACLLFAHLAVAAVCPVGYRSLRGGCFRLVYQTKSYEAAEAHCRAEKSTLADVADTAQLTALLNHINANAPGTFWLSGHYESGNFKFANTKRQVPQDWRGRRFQNRNNVCVYICSHTNRVWDSPCSAAKRFICKTKLDLDLEGVDAF